MKERPKNKRGEELVLQSEKVHGLKEYEALSINASSQRAKVRVCRHGRPADWLTDCEQKVRRFQVELRNPQPSTPPLNMDHRLLWSTLTQLVWWKPMRHLRELAHSCVCVSVRMCKEDQFNKSTRSLRWGHHQSPAEVLLSPAPSLARWWLWVEGQLQRGVRGI